MPLNLKTQRDGSLRPTWYGRYEVNGRKYFVNLGVKIRGTPPASLKVKDTGDTAFEQSRVQAQIKLDGIIEEARSNSNAIHLVEKLYEMKTGETIRSIKLEDMAEEWAKIPRRRTPDERYATQCKATLERIAKVIRQENPKVLEIAQITRTLARRVMELEGDRGVSTKTWNDTLKLLRATFKYLLPPGSINPFDDIPTQDTETVFRKPFSPDELKLILEAANEDAFIRPVILLGICTAMRRGDCCLLSWKDVDMERRFITVKTAKTGQTVSIPIFPLLYDELASLPQKQSGYVLPQQAAMYLENPDGITWRVKKVLAQALREPAEEQPSLPELLETEARRRGHAYIAGITNSDKRERMKVVFDLYMDGKSTKELLAATNVSKGSISGYLNEIEAAAGCKIVRGRPNGGSLTSLVKNDGGLLTTTREGAARKASVRDFHSFRVTWVTLALTAGVPLELVQKVTGHKTTDIVLKHYFQPGREAFRNALTQAMPRLLTYRDSDPEAAAVKSPKDELRDLIQRVVPETFRAEKLRMLTLLIEI